MEPKSTSQTESKNHKFEIINHKSKILHYFPAVLLTVGIAVVSLVEAPYVQVDVRMSDKLIHGLMYLFLALFWALPLNHKSQIKNHTIICVLVTLYGGLLELLQHYCTTTRSGEWLDLLADFLGALIGVILVTLINIGRLGRKGRLE